MVSYTPLGLLPVLCFFLEPSCPKDSAPLLPAVLQEAQGSGKGREAIAK